MPSKGDTRRLGIWGVDCAHIKAMVPPNLLGKTLYISEKRKNGPNIASFNGHAHVICWIYVKSNCTRGFLVKFWYKTSYVCPQTRNNKGTMVISVMLVLIYHRHYTHGPMKTPDSGHFVNQRRTLRCKSQLVQHCPN